MKPPLGQWIGWGEKGHVSARFKQNVDRDLRAIGPHDKKQRVHLVKQTLCTYVIKALVGLNCKCLPLINFNGERLLPKPKVQHVDFHVNTAVQSLPNGKKKDF